jgi:hypothetical protein
MVFFVERSCLGSGLTEWLRGGGGPWKGKAPSYAPSAGTKASSGAGEAGPRRGCGRERREAGPAEARGVAARRARPRQLARRSPAARPPLARRLRRSPAAHPRRSPAGGEAGRGGGGLCRCGAAAIGGMGSTSVDSPGQLTILWLRRRDMGRTILAPRKKP